MEKVPGLGLKKDAFGIYLFSGKAHGKSEISFYDPEYLGY